jgi:protein-arginine kinase activator protein McsA
MRGSGGRRGEEGVLLGCERCGTSFSERRGHGLASCPRCRVRDGVRAPLVRAQGAEVVSVIGGRVPAAATARERREQAGS